MARYHCLWVIDYFAGLPGMRYKRCALNMLQRLWLAAGDPRADEPCLAVPQKLLLRWAGSASSQYRAVLELERIGAIERTGHSLGYLHVKLCRPNVFDIPDEIFSEDPIEICDSQS